MSKFTPGPWTIQDEPGCCFHEGNHYAITQEGEDQGESWWATIAEIWPTSGDKGKADARLITAAPEMYELLSAAISICDFMDAGVLIRSTKNDAGPDWAMKQIPLVKAVKGISQARRIKAEIDGE